MVSFEPLEIISICIVIAAIIIVSPQWLMLWEKHKKEKRIRESPLCNIPKVPQINTTNYPLNNQLNSNIPSMCPTPNLGKFPTSYN